MYIYLETTIKDELSLKRFIVMLDVIKNFQVKSSFFVFYSLIYFTPGLLFDLPLWECFQPFVECSTEFVSQTLLNELLNSSSRHSYFNDEIRYIYKSFGLNFSGYLLRTIWLAQLWLVMRCLSELPKCGKCLDTIYASYITSINIMQSFPPIDQSSLTFK